MVSVKLEHLPDRLPRVATQQEQAGQRPPHSEHPDRTLRRCGLTTLLLPPASWVLGLGPGGHCGKDLVPVLQQHQMPLGWVQHQRRVGQHGREPVGVRGPDQVVQLAVPHPNRQREVGQGEPPRQALGNPVVSGSSYQPTCSVMTP